MDMMCFQILVIDQYTVVESIHELSDTFDFSYSRNKMETDNCIKKIGQHTTILTSTLSLH